MDSDHQATPTAGSTRLSITEKQFQQTITDMAKALGWRVYHTYDSRRSAPGFPDLVLVRDRIVYLELKTETGKVSHDQAGWIAAITAAGGTARVVRPSDLPEIERSLKSPPPSHAAADAPVVGGPSAAASDGGNKDNAA